MKWCRLLIGLLGLNVLVACSLLDEFWLGKDNTFQPTPLKPFKPTLSVEEVAAKSVGTRAKGRGVFYKLSPVLWDGKFISATSDGQVQAIDQNSLALVWRHFIDEPLAAGPAIGSGSVAVTSVKANLFVLDDKTGKLKWKHSLSNQSLAKPLITGGQVFVKTVDGRLSAFELVSGRQLWQVQHEQPKVVLRADSSPVLVQNSVLCGFADGELAAFNRNSGQELWSHQVVSSSGVSDAERMVDIAANPIVEANTLYLGSYQGKVSSFNLYGLTTRWSHNLSLYQNMTLGQNALYVVDANSTLWAIDKNNGLVLWRQEDLKYRQLSAPTFYKGRVFVGDKLGYIHVLSARTGKVVARVRPSRGEVELVPLLANDKLYALNEQGLLKVYKVG